MPEALTKDKTIELIKEYQKYGDIEVRDKIIYGNMRFITYCLNKYGRRVVNCISPIYPSFEDLEQEAVLVTMKSIDKFNPDYNFTFATFLDRNLRNAFGMIKRSSISKCRDAVVLSLSEPMGDNRRHADEEGQELEDMLADESFTEDILHDKIELEYIKKEILPLLTSSERGIFEDYYFNELTQEDIGDKYGYSRTYISKLIPGILDKVSVYYLNGVTDLDRLLKGVARGKRNRFVKCNAIINKYGKEFLEQYYLPTLAKNQRAIFEKGILYYRGQETEEIAKSLGLSKREVENTLNSFDKKLADEVPALKQLEKEGKLPKARKLPLKVQQKINRNNRLMEQYGGRLFLAKYFLSTLPEGEARIFEFAVLDYNGESLTQLARKSGVTVSAFATGYNRITDKLAKTDFEALVSLVDSAEVFDGKIGTVNSQKLDYFKQRQSIVEQYGGKERLERLFMPVLPDSQKRVLQDMYLTPKFDSFQTMAQAYGMSVQPLCVAEKTMLEKLKSTNLDELERLRQVAERELRLDRSEKSRETLNRGIRINSLGGAEFLKANFVPTLQVKAHRIVFESYMIENKPIRDVLEELGLPEKATDYIDKTTDLLNNRLIAFRNGFEDFDKAVKDFYTKREFERAHPENFEELALGVKKEEKPEELEEIVKITNVGNVEMGAKRRRFMQGFLAKYGERRDLVRRFMPTLKKVTEQQVFVGFFLEGKMDADVREEYNLTEQELKSTKLAVLGKLEEYSKTSKGGKQKSTKIKGGK